MLYGIRPEEQKRLAETGETVRVYIPYGQEWYGYLMRRLAERPQNLSFFVRSLDLQEVGRTDGPDRDHRRRRDGRDPAVGAGPRRTPRRQPAGRREASRAGPRARGAVRRRGGLQRRGRPQGRHRRARGQAAGHGRPCSTRSPPSCVPASCWSAWPPASPPPSSSRACPRASRSCGSCPTRPALVDEGMAAISPGSHCDEAHLAEAESLMASTGQVMRDPRAPAGRGHRDQRLRSGLHLLRRRVDDRGGRPPRPAARHLDRAGHPDALRLRHDAARDGHPPGRAARAGHLARRHHRRPRCASWRSTRSARRSSPRWRPRATARASSPRAPDRSARRVRVGQQARGRGQDGAGGLAVLVLDEHLVAGGDHGGHRAEVAAPARRGVPDQAPTRGRTAGRERRGRHAVDWRRAQGSPSTHRLRMRPTNRPPNHSPGPAQPRGQRSTRPQVEAPGDPLDPLRRSVRRLPMRAGSRRGTRHVARGGRRRPLRLLVGVVDRPAD